MIQLAGTVAAPRAEVVRVLDDVLVSPATETLKVYDRGPAGSRFNVRYQTDDQTDVLGDLVRLSYRFRARGWNLTEVIVYDGVGNAHPVDRVQPLIDQPATTAGVWGPRQCMAAGFGAAVGIIAATAAVTDVLVHLH